MVLAQGQHWKTQRAHYLPLKYYYSIVTNTAVILQYFRSTVQ